MPFTETTILGKLSAPVVKWLVLAFLAAFGAAAHALVRLQKARENNKPFDKVDVFIAFFVACFAGVVYSLLSEWVGFDNIGQRVSTLIGSFLGLAGLNRIIEIIFSAIEKQVKDSR